MTDNVFDMLIVPQDVMHTCAKRARDLRLSQNITQKELAERVGVAEGTIKRFEHTGEVQFRTLLGIALVLGRSSFWNASGPGKIPAGPNGGPSTRSATGHSSQTVKSSISAVKWLRNFPRSDRVRRQK